MIKGNWAHFCSSLCFHLTCKSPFHHSQSYLMQQLVSAWAWKLLNCMFVQVLLFLRESEVSSIKKLKHCNTWCLGPDCNPKHKVPRVCFSLNHLIQNQKKWASFPAVHPQHLDVLKAGTIAQAQCLPHRWRTQCFDRSWGPGLTSTTPSSSSSSRSKLHTAGVLGRKSQCLV